jgi:hypothetical protein
MTLTPELLQQLRAALEKRTPGEWFAEDHPNCWELYAKGVQLDQNPLLGDGYGHPMKIIKAPKVNSNFAEYWPNENDARAIVLAVNHAGEMIREIESLRELEKMLRRSESKLLDECFAMAAELERLSGRKDKDR